MPHHNTPERNNKHCLTYHNNQTVRVSESVDVVDTMSRHGVCACGRGGGGGGWHKAGVAVAVMHCTAQD